MAGGGRGTGKSTFTLAPLRSLIYFARFIALAPLPLRSLHCHCACLASHLLCVVHCQRVVRDAEAKAASGKRRGAHDGDAQPYVGVDGEGRRLPLRKIDRAVFYYRIVFMRHVSYYCGNLLLLPDEALDDAPDAVHVAASATPSRCYPVLLHCQDGHLGGVRGRREWDLNERAI